MQYPDDVIGSVLRFLPRNSGQILQAHGELPGLFLESREFVEDEVVNILAGRNLLLICWKLARNVALNKSEFPWKGVALLNAIKDKDLDAAHMLLSLYSTLKISSHNAAMILLFYACQEGRSKFVKLLLGRGYRPYVGGDEQPNHDNLTFEVAEHMVYRAAAENGNMENIKMLIPLIPEDKRDYVFEAMFGAAIYGKQAEVVKFIHKMGGRFTQELFSRLCEFGELDLVEYVYESKQVSVGGSHNIALDCAITGGHTDVVKFLLKKSRRIRYGAKMQIAAFLPYSVSLKNIKRAICHAAERGYTGTLKSLHRYRESLIDYKTLWKAVKGGYTHTVEYLLSLTTSLKNTAPKSSGETQSEKTLSERNWLLNPGANDNEAMRIAVDKANLTMIECLLKYKNRGVDEFLVMEIALDHDSLELFKEIVELPKIGNNSYSEGIFTAAVERNCVKIPTFMLKITPDLATEETLLVACRRNLTFLVNQMTKSGAPVTNKIMSVALYLRHFEIIEILKIHAKRTPP